MIWDKGSWAGADGPIEWTEGDVAYLSVVFSWHLPKAYERALWYRAQGFRVRAGGPGVFRQKGYLDAVAEVGGPPPNREVLTMHNPMATRASLGCDVGCFFCIVPALEGSTFTLLPDFTPRPVLTDNNLSALPADYQCHIVERYQRAGVPLLDANSGFEPKTFDEDVYERWRPINRGAWRFASDETGERDDVRRALQMLRRRGVGSRRIQVYTMIGHEPVAECLDRIYEVLALGGEPYVQPIMKLNTLEKKPWVRHDWTPLLLKRVQRWANRRGWRKAPRFEHYRPSLKTADAPDPRQGELSL